MKVLHRLHVYYIYLEFIDKLIKHYGTKLIRDKLEDLDDPKRVEAKGILKTVYNDTLISKKDNDLNIKLVNKLIEDNVLRQIEPEDQYTWHSPIVKSGYEICTIYNNTIIYNNL